MRPSRCLGSFNPSECELDGAAIDDAATEKLRQKGMPFLRDYLVHNNHGGLTGLQTGSAELVAFETRIIECTATTGAKKPAGCGQFVPAGIAAAVSALGESCMKLARPSDLRYAAEMLLAVDMNQQNTQSGRLAFLKDSATTSLQTLSGGRYTYELRTMLEGQPLVIAGDAQSLAIHQVCASS